MSCTESAGLHLNVVHHGNGSSRMKCRQFTHVGGPRIRPRQASAAASEDCVIPLFDLEHDILVFGRLCFAQAECPELFILFCQLLSYFLSPPFPK